MRLLNIQRVVELTGDGGQFYWGTGVNSTGVPQSILLGTGVNATGVIYTLSNTHYQRGFATSTQKQKTLFIITLRFASLHAVISLIYFLFLLTGINIVTAYKGGLK